MGYDLMTNFRRPILVSKSVQEVWQRWHISLTTWFRDYLYFPLGGNRRGQWITMRNMLIVFAISGLWHGANWTFVIWGLLNGSFIVIENIFKPVFRKIHKLLGPTSNFFRAVATFWYVRPALHSFVQTPSAMVGISGSRCSHSSRVIFIWANPNIVRVLYFRGGPPGYYRTCNGILSQYKTGKKRQCCNKVYRLCADPHHHADGRRFQWWSVYLFPVLNSL